MLINDSYYKNKTKLKKFHISLLICFVLFFILFILAYFRFMFLYKVVFLCNVYGTKYYMTRDPYSGPRGIKAEIIIGIINRTDGLNAITINN